MSSVYDRNGGAIANKYKVNMPFISKRIENT